MKTYIFSFVAEVCGEKIIKDIKQMHAMALEEEFKKPFICVEIREVQE